MKLVSHPLMALLLLLDTPVMAVVRILPSPGGALSAAWADAGMLNPEEARYMRYLWVPEGEAGFRVAALVVNMISRAGVMHRPKVFKGLGGEVLCRVDLRGIAPKEKDLHEVTKAWEELRFDPAFNLLLTRGTLRGAVALYPNLEVVVVTETSKDELVDSEPYVQNGQVFHQRWVKKKILSEKKVAIKDVVDVNVLRLPAPHLDPRKHGELSHLLHTAAPVVRAPYFYRRALTTIQDKGVFKEIYGGLYYALAGIPRAAAKGTDEDALLLLLGLAVDPEKGVGAKELFDRLRSDRRVAIFRSGVTGGPRRMDFFRTQTGFVDEVGGLISFSHDLFQDSIDIDTHPAANLLVFKDDGREVIWERANGLHGYSAYNGQGAIANEVPNTIANDRTIPAPHPPRLQAAISCIACHEAEGSDGWKPVSNDVKRLLGRGKKLDVFGDLSAGRRALDTDTLERLAGLYGGDPERALQKGRDDYARSVLLATGPWQECAKNAQADIVKVATGHLVRQVRSHVYDLVTPATALAELGVGVADARDAVKVLNDLLPPDPQAQVGNIILEDVRLAALKEGLAVSRADWDLVMTFAADRAKRAVAHLPAR